ncbi:HAMP domain-containing sensor histidine kinase [Hyphomicrobium sp.]|uniref:sensor histidine kinase n=1 Tax=Hyphomicrobium sp. TaxID=82 RepID=UPI0025BBF873|nr:HAMP domain-containing sensor histidine kinase [Hyphomicrobium sp.]MCC7251599.1 HAMP domain-containing histidine kinase [Hyphomicrobium sp.]
MKRAHIKAFAEDLPALALSQLEAGGRAAWMIDIAGGRILAASAAGSVLLGLEDDGAPPLLDASMPALARLRSLAAAPGRDSAAAERLVLWGRDGAVSLRCRVEILGAAPHSLAVVTALSDASGATVPRTAGPPAPFTGDDAKLKEIARRIREGQMTGAQPERRTSVGKRAQPPDDAGASGSAAPSEGAGPTRATNPAHAEPFLPVSVSASLAHELKTPVAAIAAAAEIMKDERFGPLGGARYVGYASDIYGSAQHVLRLIDRMLADSRVETDAARDLAFAEIDVGDVLQALVSQLGPLAEAAGIALTLDLTPRLPHVIADATSLRQMVFNLVTNALKFTQHGGHVTVGAHYNGEGPLVIAVSDTGPGLPHRELERLRAPDQCPRPGARGAADGLGLGLGLPLVQALAAANGAELVIESTPGKGTSASIFFAKDRVVPV